MGFRFLKCKEFFSGFPFPEVQENIIKFLISEPESSISENIRKYKNFFRVDIFWFLRLGLKSVAGSCTYHYCFPVKLAQILRIPFLKEIYE